MKKSIKKQWVKALRSGDYCQTTEGKLLDESGYCCLGVLGNIINSRKWHYEDATKEWLWGTAAERSELDGDSYLPESILNSDTQHVLAYKNDAEYSFEKIADWIEENL